MIANNLIFDTEFDSGNGVNFVEVSPDHWTFQVEAEDPSWLDETSRWFYFKVTNNNTTRTIYVKATNTANSGKIWPVWSTDQQTWTYFTDAQLTHGGGWIGWLEMKIDLTPNQVKWVAWGLPYTYSDYISWVNTLSSQYLNKTIIGYSAQNRPIWGLEITNFSIPKSSKVKFYTHGMVHGNTESYPFAQIKGAVNWLLNESDAYARKVRNEAIWYIIPCINPDGIYLGNSKESSQVNLPDVWTPTLWDDYNETKTAVNWIDSSYVGGVNVAIDLHDWETGNVGDGNGLFRNSDQNTTAKEGVRSAWKIRCDVNEEGQGSQGTSGFKSFFYAQGLVTDCTFTWEVQYGKENGDGPYIQDPFLQQMGENWAKAVSDYYVEEPI